MPEARSYLKSLLGDLCIVRKKKGLSRSALEERLILGPGWIRRFEAGETVPSIDMLLAILYEMRASLDDLLQGLPESDVGSVERVIFAEQTGRDITIHFRYANFDACYILPNATLDDFEKVIKTLRDGLARLSGNDHGQSEAIKTDSVARCFLEAVQLWPKANPSDLWWFLVYRAYCDPYNYPAQFARLDFTQSWKRTGGWALEEILVRHYGPFLKQRGIDLFIADSATKRSLVASLKLASRVEADKIDVVLTGDRTGGSRSCGQLEVEPRSWPPLRRR